MDHTQIELLAQAVAHQTFMDQWPYWAALIGFVILAVFFGGIVGSYAAKRGEVMAAKADRKEILDGLRVTTEAAEEVRSAVSLTEWTERERRSLRRAKLEEMLLLAYRTREWLSEEVSRMADPNLPERPSPQSTMMALGSLYFPELYPTLRAFDRACSEYAAVLHRVRIDVMKARAMYYPDTANAEAHAGRIMQDANEEILAGYTGTIQPLFDLDDAARALMKKIIASPE